MKTLIIIARESMLSDLEGFLESHGVTAYTILSHVMGKGVTGRMYGTFLHPDINAIIFAVLPSDQADRAVSALKTFHHARRNEPSHDDKSIPLKVFSFPCEEHIQRYGLERVLYSELPIGKEYRRSRWQAAGLAGLVPRYPPIRARRVADSTVALIEYARGDLHFGAVRTRIWPDHLTSAVGEGTIVSIWLPISQDIQVVKGQPVHTVIVVTGDEPAIREALVKQLMRQGHHAVGYESREALLAGLQHSLPDLVLLNLKLPGLTGLETLQQVRQLAPAAIVIILTAYGTMEDAVETITLGTDDFVIKSVDLKGLDVVITRALDVLKLRQRLADRTCDLSVWGLDKT